MEWRRRLGGRRSAGEKCMGSRRVEGPLVATGGSAEEAGSAAFCAKVVPSRGR